jgi:hypothetical protein
MTKLVRGVQIIDFGFLTELVTANTHPTRSAITLNLISTDFLFHYQKIQQ